MSFRGVRSVSCLRTFAVCLAALLVFQQLAAAQLSTTPSSIKIEVIEGEGAINNIRLGSAKAPVVRVLDDDNRPLRGAVVTFVAPEIGPSATFGDRGGTLSLTTDMKGIAAGTSLRPNNVAGEFQIRVTATYQGRNATASITQTNAAPAAARSGATKKIVIIGLIAGAAAGAAFAAKGGGKSSTTSTTTTGTTLTPGSPVFGPPR